MVGILALLIAEWPNPVTIRPSNVMPYLDHRKFVAAIQALQDDGMIMSEALLIGAGPEPTAIGVLITRKGRDYFNERGAAPQ